MEMQNAGLFTHHIVGKTALVVVRMTENSRYNPFLKRQSFFGGLCIPFTSPNFQFSGLVQITVNAFENKIKKDTNNAENPQRLNALTLSHNDSQLILPLDESMNRHTNNYRLRFELMPPSMGIPQSQPHCPDYNGQKLYLIFFWNRMVVELTYESSSNLKVESANISNTTAGCSGRFVCRLCRYDGLFALIHAKTTNVQDILTIERIEPNINDTEASDRIIFGHFSDGIIAWIAHVVRNARALLIIIVEHRLWSCGRHECWIWRYNYAESSIRCLLCAEHFIDGFLNIGIRWIRWQLLLSLLAKTLWYSIYRIYGQQ